MRVLVHGGEVGHEDELRRLPALRGAHTGPARAEEHPGFCKVESISRSCRSYEGREIWLAELTNLKTGPAETKPAFWVDGNIHAGEVTGSMAALYLIEHLL
ncbi:MAG TPA: M14 family zinc carboxypeptidase, partial [Rubrobacter sp.]|nr:M14 family zinc carboxypeptidase [Rubrobacter sp.]